jgi:hypothetical protein
MLVAFTIVPLVMTVKSYAIKLFSKCDKLLALLSDRSNGSLVGIFRLRTHATEFVVYLNIV